MEAMDADSMSILKPFLKSKWCNAAYFQAQVCAPFGAWRRRSARDARVRARGNVANSITNYGG